MVETNETHNPNLRSWVRSANCEGCEFPVQNLPFGIFRCNTSTKPCGGVAIGDKVIALTSIIKEGLQIEFIYYK